MAGLGPRSAIERAEIGNSRPTVVRACALLDLPMRLTQVPKQRSGCKPELPHCIWEWSDHTRRKSYVA